MPSEINEYLNKLHENSKLNKLLSDDDTEINVNVDVYSGQYTGADLRFYHKDKLVDLSTRDRRILVSEGKKSSETLEPITALAIDKAVLQIFNPNRVDEDNFKDQAESIEAEIEAISASDSLKVINALASKLSEIQTSDYNEELIKDLVKSTDIKNKGDHLVIERYLNGTHVKYNAGKDKLTVKNNYNFKEKSKLSDLVKDFDSNLFLSVIENYYHKKMYNEKRLDLDDGIGEYYDSFPNGSVIPVRDDIDHD